MIIMIWILAGLAGGAIGFRGAWLVDKKGYALIPGHWLRSKAAKAVGVLFWGLAIIFTIKGAVALLALTLALNVVWVMFVSSRVLIKTI
ncbi:hypothetical protein ACLIX5_004452 [Salmonella enterica subsp. enterica serovar Bredeney]